MAKRKKGSKVQKRAKLQRGNSAKCGKAAKVAMSAKATKRAKPKRAPAKKGRLPVGPVETVAAEIIEQPAPGVTEVEENGK